MVHGDVQEVRVRANGHESEFNELSGESFTLGDLTRDVRRRGERRHREGRRERRDGQGCLTRTDHRDQLRRRDRVADTCAGQSERFGERAQNDRAVVHAIKRVDAGVFGVGLVDDELPGYLRDVGQLAGRIVRSTHEDEVGLRGVVDHRGTRHQRGVAVHRIGNRGHRGDRGALCEDARAQHDELVAASTECDLVECDAVVPRNGLAKRFVASAVVLVDIGQRPSEGGGTGTRRRRRRDVAVESHDRSRVDADPRGDGFVRRRPLVGVECGGLGHRRAVALCMGMPSSSASASIVGARRSRPSLVTRWTVTVFMNVSSPRPPVDFDQPPVGSTWLPPVA